MANPHDSSEENIPDSIRFSAQDWQRLRAEYPADGPISESGADTEKNKPSDQSLVKLIKTDLKTAAEDIKNILPCLPEKERERFIREFGEMLWQ